MMKDHMHEWSDSKNATLFKHSKIMKQILVTNTMHTCTLVASKNTFMMNPHFLVLRFSQNFEDRIYYATQYQDISIQYNECFTL